MLEGFLGKFADKAPLALEFRHESWFESATFELLRDYQASLGVVESDKLEAVREITAPFTYMRLRKSEYSRKEIEGWAEWIRGRGWRGVRVCQARRSGPYPGPAVERGVG